LKSRIAKKNEVMKRSAESAILNLITTLCVFIMTSTDKDKKIIIEGVTSQGKAFRPSDWAERMSESMASFKNRRIHYYSDVAAQCES